MRTHEPQPRPAGIPPARGTVETPAVTALQAIVQNAGEGVPALANGTGRAEVTLTAKGVGPKHAADVAALRGEQTVLMHFPRKVNLNARPAVDATLVFEAGLQNVPVSLAGHAYLRAAGATLQEPGTTLVEVQQRQRESAVSAARARLEAIPAEGHRLQTEVSAKKRRLEMIETNLGTVGVLRDRSGSGWSFADLNTKLNHHLNLEPKADDFPSAELVQTWRAGRVQLEDEIRERGAQRTEFIAEYDRTVSEINALESQLAGLRIERQRLSSIAETGDGEAWRREQLHNSGIDPSQLQHETKSVRIQHTPGHVPVIA